MERETKTIETPSGHKVVIKTYLTAGERRAMDSVVYSQASFTVEGATAHMKEMSGAVINAIQDETLRQVVVSVDLIVEDVAVACLNLPEKDFAVLDAAIKGVIEGDPKG